MVLRTILIKPVSSLCNMKCSYCFYVDESSKRGIKCYGMMSEETLKNIIRKALLQAQGEICFAFQGGEPTLRGIDFFRKALELEQKYNKNHVRIKNALQTNGLCIDEEWCRLFREGDFLVGVSVDGTKTVHDGYRHDKGGAPTYDRICRNVQLLEEHRVEYNILTVVTRQTAESIGDIYGEYKRRGWKYQQYILCLDPLYESWGKAEYSLTPEVWGRFLIRLFRLWDKDWRRGKAPYIRLFENYIGMLLGYPPEACEQNGVCSIQCVAEADGSAYPCDFYVLDEYRLGNYNTDRIQSLTDCERAVGFVEESRRISQDCRQCRWLFLCRGGCRRCRVRADDTETWKNYFCAGYQMFFEACAERLIEIAQFLRQK